MGRRRGKGKQRGNVKLGPVLTSGTHDEKVEASTKVDKSPIIAETDEFSEREKEDAGVEFEEVIEVVGSEEMSGEEYEEEIIEVDGDEEIVEEYEEIVEEIEEIVEVEAEEVNEEELEDVGEEPYEAEEWRENVDGKTDENEEGSEDEHIEEGESENVEEEPDSGGVEGQQSEDDPEECHNITIQDEQIKSDPEEYDNEEVEEQMEDVEEELYEETEGEPSEDEQFEEVVAQNQRASLNKQENSKGQVTERPGAKVHSEQKGNAEFSGSVSKSFPSSNILKQESYHAHSFPNENKVGADVLQMRQDSSKDQPCCGTHAIVLKSDSGGSSFHKEGANVSPIKRKHSRWDSQLESHHNSCETGDEVVKKRKSRWSSSSDDNLVKVPDLLQIPRFFNDDEKIIQDPEIQELVKELKNISQKFLGVIGVEDSINNELTIKKSIAEASLRAEFVKRKQQIFSLLLKKGFDFKSLLDGKSSKTKIHIKKIYVPVKEYPDYNFIGLFFGPRGNNHKRMELESGATIKLRGKGSTKESKTVKGTPDPLREEDLHVLIEADNKESLNSAAQMVEKLLTPVAETENELKRAQLRELAALKGKIAPDDLCGICGDASHYTRHCPLIAGAPGGSGQPIKGLAGIDAGRSSTSKINLIDASSAGQLLMSRQGNQKIDDRKLFVGQLPFSVDDDRLMKLFCQYGRVHDARVVKDANTGASQGYAFVKYHHPADAAKAVKQMHGFLLEGRTLTVEICGLPAKTVGSTDLKKTARYQQASQSCLSVLPVSHTPTYRPVALSFAGFTAPVQNDFTSHSRDISASRPAVSSYPASTLHSPAPTYNSPADLVTFSGNLEKVPAGRLFSSGAANAPRHEAVFGSHVYPSYAATFGSISLIRPTAANVLPPLSRPPLVLPPADSLNFPGNPDSFRSRFL